MNDYARELEAAKGLALKASDIMRAYFDTDKQVESKADGTPVTVADTAINRMVIEELARHFDDGIVGEEESTAGYGMGRCWFCDPIDGTKAFVQGVPTSTFSLGLVVDGLPVLGVVHDPFQGKTYAAVRGQGATRNGAPIRVSDLPLAGSYVAVTRGLASIVANPELVAGIISRQAVPLSFNGAVFASTLVAQGKAVGYFDARLQPHDLAAVQVIVEEAGGRVTACDGTPLDYSAPFTGGLVANQAAYGDLLACAAEAVS